MRNYFIRPIKIEDSNLYLIWYQNDHDGLVLNDSGSVLAFGSKKQLRKFAESHSMELRPTDRMLIDLDFLANWLKEPDPKGVDCFIFLESWNLFGDLRSSIENRNTDPDDNKHLHIYDKLFYGNNLPAVTPEGREYEPIWTEEDVLELRDVLEPGLNLFRNRLLKMDKNASS